MCVRVKSGVNSRELQSGVNSEARYQIPLMHGSAIGPDTCRAILGPRIEDFSSAPSHQRWKAKEGRKMGEEEEPREWIGCDESGRDMVSRLLLERAFIIPLPPLHRVPLRLGNIVEISGPSNSAKSQVLVQVCQATARISEFPLNLPHLSGHIRFLVYLVAKA